MIFCLEEAKKYFLREAQKNTPKLVIFFRESEKIHERSEKYEFWPEKAKIRKPWVNPCFSMVFDFLRESIVFEIFSRSEKISKTIHQN